MLFAAIRFFATARRDAAAMATLSDVTLAAPHDAVFAFAVTLLTLP